MSQIKGLSNVYKMVIYLLEYIVFADPWDIVETYSYISVKSTMIPIICSDYNHTDWDYSHISNSPDIIVMLIRSSLHYGQGAEYFCLACIILALCPVSQKDQAWI